MSQPLQSCATKPSPPQPSITRAFIENRKHSTNIPWSVLLGPIISSCHWLVSVSFYKTGELVWQSCDSLANQITHCSHANISQALHLTSLINRIACAFLSLGWLIILKTPLATRVHPSRTEISYKPLYFIDCIQITLSDSH